MTRGATSALLPALVALLLAGPAAAVRAQDKTRADELLDQGDYFFKAGYFFRAADSYRLALLEDPTSPWKKLAFGHSLFATGQYGYAAFALRKGVGELDPAQTFAPEVAELFPSRRRFQQALRDLKRSVTYSPRDPAGLTVLGYVLYTIPGEERRCRDIFRYLKKLDPDDAFASFFLGQLDRRKSPAEAPARTSARAVQVLLRDFDDALVLKLRAALQVHPGVKDLAPDTAGPYPRLRFDWEGKERVETSLQNVLKSLGLKHTLRPIPRPEESEEAPLTFIVALEKPEPKPEGATPAPPAPKRSLKEQLPPPSPERERLENEWPAPAPAPAR
ncbi:MAG: tetratricopeptide repeat protein [Planctomycetota bacterium]